MSVPQSINATYFESKKISKSYSESVARTSNLLYNYGMLIPEKFDFNRTRRDLYNFLLDNHTIKPSELGYSSIVFWFVIRQILWWIATKFLEDLLDTTTSAQYN